MSAYGGYSTPVASPGKPPAASTIHSGSSPLMASSANLSTLGTGQTPTSPSASTSAPESQKPEQKEVHSLTFKVMRLSKPGFQVSLPLIHEKTDVVGKVLLPETTVEQNGLDAYGVSDSLLLPQSFGNIFLGETFVSYISVHNHTPFDVKNVSVKCELQTATQRFTLLEIGAMPVAVFPSSESQDFIIQHDVKELGTHILVCTVSYTKHDGEKKYFRKFFKFQVTNPVVIKTETHDLQYGTFLAATIQNATAGALYLESVKFDPSSVYTVTDLNSTDKAASNALEDLVYLKPGDIQQYLFRLDPKQNLPFDSRHKLATIGKLDICWKSNFGETGKLQTAPLERKLATQTEMELLVRKIPDCIQLEQPFIIQFELTNTSDRVIQPQFTFLKQHMAGIMVNGLSGQRIEKLEAGGTTQVNVSLFPLKPGVQKISGIRVVDSLTYKAVDFLDVVDVFVES